MAMKRGVYYIQQQQKQDLFFTLFSSVIVGSVGHLSKWLNCRPSPVLRQKCDFKSILCLFVKDLLVDFSHLPVHQKYRHFR